MHCVVCDANVETAKVTYANAWERAIGVHPCCSDACAQRFDVDIHWLPSFAPTRASDQEVRRLLGIARGRLVRGDHARMIVRDLLLAGVSPERVRDVIVVMGVRGAAAQREATGMTIALSAFSLLAGYLTFWKPTKGAEIVGAVDAHTDIEAWTKRFGGSEHDAQTPYRLRP